MQLSKGKAKAATVTVYWERQAYIGITAMQSSCGRAAAFIGIVAATATVLLLQGNMALMVRGLSRAVLFPLSQLSE